MIDTARGEFEAAIAIARRALGEFEKAPEVESKRLRTGRLPMRLLPSGASR